jgi:hypothetical protein
MQTKAKPWLPTPKQKMETIAKPIVANPKSQEIKTNPKRLVTNPKDKKKPIEVTNLKLCILTLTSKLIDD